MSGKFDIEQWLIDAGYDVGDDYIIDKDWERLDAFADELGDELVLDGKDEIVKKVVKKFGVVRLNKKERESKSKPISDFSKSSSREEELQISKEESK